VGPSALLVAGMEALAPLRAVVDGLGAEVRTLKDAGKDFSEPLAKLKEEKQKLSDAAQALLASSDDLDEATKKDLQSLVIEDKKAKKKREKEEKRKKEEAAAAAAAAAGGGGKAGEALKKDGPSKKELNKLKKKANKQAAKSGETAAPAAADVSAAPAKAAGSTVPQSQASVAVDMAFPFVSSIASSLVGKPAITGGKAQLKVGSTTLQGDHTVARFVAREAGKLYGQDAAVVNEAAGEVDQWIELTSNYNVVSESTLKALDVHLEARTFMAAHSLTLADVAVWAALARALGGKLPSGGAVIAKFPAVVRWAKSLEAIKAFSAACSAYRQNLEKATKNGKTNAKGSGKDGKGGAAKAKEKHNLPPLKNAKEGEVVTRFPPEPSGHLHIGHFKALFLNKYYADRYNGKMLLRFDDTNPSKEKVEYEEGIIKDLETIGIVPASISWTSDHFETIIEFAIKMIKEGKAYMDDASGETMSIQRKAGEDSARRNEQVEDNLVRFFGMLFGPAAETKSVKYGVTLTPEQVTYITENAKEMASKWCLRAKIDLETRAKHKGNKTLFDPVIFRSNTDHHARTKDKYKAYPTYDLACPIVDSIEGVTHAMRDRQYLDREPLYMWFFPNLGLRKVTIQDFSRLNFVSTLLSKRKLAWFVDTGRVANWSDPRFPTVKGIMRRGMQIPALYDFMIAQGASKSVVDLEWDKFWNLNKKQIDPVAPRFMAISLDSHTEIQITDMEGKPFPESHKLVPLLPKDKDGQEFGLKSLFLGPTVLVETEDINGAAEGVPRITVGERIVLLNWGVVEITELVDGPDGSFSKITARFDPEGDFKAPPKKIQWVSKSIHNVPIKMHEFDFLITKPKLEENDNVADFFNTNSHAVTDMIGEPGMRSLGTNSFLQVLRRGYMRVDEALKKDGTPLQIFMIPDGKQSAMSTIATKLTHR